MQSFPHLSGDVRPASASSDVSIRDTSDATRGWYDPDTVHPAEQANTNRDQLENNLPAESEDEQESNEQTAWRETREKLERAYDEIQNAFEPIKDIYHYYINGTRKNIVKSYEALEHEVSIHVEFGNGIDIPDEFDRLSQYLRVNRQRRWSTEEFSARLKELTDVIERNNSLIKVIDAQREKLAPEAVHNITWIKISIEGIRRDVQEIEEHLNDTIQQFMDQQDEIDKTLPFILFDIAKDMLNDHYWHAAGDLDDLHVNIDKSEDLERSLEGAAGLRWLDALLPKQLQDLPPVPENEQDPFSRLRELRETPLARYLAPQSIRDALYEHGTTGSLREEFHEQLASSFEKVSEALDLSYDKDDPSPADIYRLNQEKLAAVRALQEKRDAFQQTFSPDKDEQALLDLEELLKEDKASLPLVELTLEVAKLERAYQAVLSHGPAAEQSQRASSSAQEALNLRRDRGEEQANPLQSSRDEQTSSSSGLLDEAANQLEGLLNEIADQLDTLQKDIATRLKIEPEIIDKDLEALRNDEVAPLRVRPANRVEPEVQIEERKGQWEIEEQKRYFALDAARRNLDREKRRAGGKSLTEAEAQQLQERQATIAARKRIRDARQQVLARIDTWLEASKDRQPAFLRARRKAGRDMAQLITGQRTKLQKRLEGQLPESFNATREQLAERLEEIDAWVKRMDGLTEEMIRQIRERDPRAAPEAREIPPVFAIDALATPLERARAFTTYAGAFIDYMKRSTEANQRIRNILLVIS